MANTGFCLCLRVRQNTCFWYFLKPNVQALLRAFGPSTLSLQSWKVSTFPPYTHIHTHAYPLTSLAYSRASVLCGAQDPNIRGGFGEDYRGPSSSDCRWGQVKGRDLGPKAGGRQGAGGGLLRSWWKSQVKPDHRAQNEAVTAT